MDIKLKVGTATLSQTGWMNVVDDKGVKYSVGPDKVATLKDKLVPGAELDLAVSVKDGEPRDNADSKKRFILGLAGASGGAGAKKPWGGGGGGRDYTKETELELLKQKSMMRLNASNNATAIVVAVLQVRTGMSNIEAMGLWKEIYLNIVTKVRAEDSSIEF